jgi:hypothetical protein
VSKKNFTVPSLRFHQQFSIGVSGDLISAFFAAGSVVEVGLCGVFGIGMQRRLRWVLAALIVCALGACNSRLFAQGVWDPKGLHRFLVYSVLFAAFACVVFSVRRTWMVPCFRPRK